MDCIHPVLYSRNCVLYCQVCGAVIPPKAEKPPEGATEAAAEGFERVGKKSAKRTASKKA